MNEEITPIQKVNDFYVKRDDLFSVAGVCGGKARTCYFLAKDAKKGLTTAGSRVSPQINIVAHIAKHLGIKCVAHTPTGKLSPELLSAKECGATIIQHKAGYNSVIIRRSRDFAIEEGYTEIPFGMECQEAVNQTRKQASNIPKDIKRIVITAGSGMSLAGVLWGLKDNNLNEVEVCAVVVGASPEKRLDKYAPQNWREKVTLQNVEVDYHKEVKRTIGGIVLDPVYESKCVNFIKPNDLFWIVGIREII